MRTIALVALMCLTACGSRRGSNGSGTPADPYPPMPVWDPALYPMPMAGNNVRRTSQSPFNGPASVSSVWTYSAPGAYVLNIQAVVTANGLYFAGWGLPRRNSPATPDTWDKSDGRFYGVSLAGTDLWPSFHPLVPAGYLDPTRPMVSRDNYWLPGTGYHVTYYNGTIEGSPCVDPVNGRLYFGRGDGKLHAIDPITGTVAWSFATFNPFDAGEDTGGEIIGGPVVGPGGTIYFATAGLPHPGSASDPAYETNALYAVNSAGGLVWRYPAETARLDNFVVCPPALSPDGRTLYVGTFAGDATVPGKLLAIDLAQPATATDAQRLKWSVTLKNTLRAAQPSIWVRHIAVGSDGRIYVGGGEAQFGGTSTIVTAFNPDGSFAWNPIYVEPQGYPAPSHWVGGFAIRETGTPVLYVSTTHMREWNQTGGQLIAMSPATGAILGTFDPSTLATPAVGSLTGPSIGANGTIYVGVRGLHPTSTSAAVNGRMVALTFNGSTFTPLWDYAVDGQLDWVTPSIGADGGLYFGSSDDRLNGSMIKNFLDPWFDMTEIPPDTIPKFYGIK